MTTPNEEKNTIWVTQEAYDRLQAELDHLAGLHAPDIATKIADARDEGDLQENGGYHAAREEQGKTEARIRQLEDMLRRAEVGEPPADDGLVEPGMVVTIRFAGDNDSETFLLGSREMLGIDVSVDIEVYSPQSPLGLAINGKKAGDSATYAARTGKRSP